MSNKEECNMSNNRIEEKGLDIHLFVEYALRYGDLELSYTSAYTKHVATVWGRPFAMNSEDEAYDLPYAEFSLHQERYVYFNKMVASLASACDLKNTRISVTVFNANGPVMVQSITNNVKSLSNCATDKTFFYKDNGGLICKGTGGLNGVRAYKELRDYVLKLKEQVPDRKQLVIFVSEISPSNITYDKQGLEKFFQEWKMDGVDFITLKLNNSHVNYKGHTSASKDFLDDNIYNKLSTMSEYTKEGNFEKICFLLSLIGQKLTKEDKKDLDIDLEEITYIHDKEYKSYSSMAAEENDIQKKIKILIRGVDEKEVSSMVEYGNLYAQGNGIDKDLVKAEEYYTMAIQAGANCYVELAKVLIQHDKNSQEAIEWLCKALREPWNRCRTFAEIEKLGMINNEQLVKKVTVYKDELLSKKQNSADEYQFLGLCYIYAFIFDRDKEKGMIFLKGAEAMGDFNSYMILRMPEVKYNDNLTEEIYRTYDNNRIKIQKKTLKKTLDILRCKKLKKQIS